MKKLSVILLFLSHSTLYAETKGIEYPANKVLTTIEAIAQTLEIIPPSYYNQLKKLHKSKNPSSEQLISLIDATSNLLNIKNPSFAESKVLLDGMKKDLLKDLESFKISGYSWAVDPNLAFFLETQNPVFDITFLDEQGNTKSRKYELNIHSLGFKIEASIKIDLILFVGTDLNFYSSNKELTLGTGIDVNVPLATTLAGMFGITSELLTLPLYLIADPLSITYAPFTNAAGGILILGRPFIFALPSLSIVTGGTLKPVTTTFE